jgi:hypothetical protein
VTSANDPSKDAPPPEVVQSVEGLQSEVHRGDSPPSVVRIDPVLLSQVNKIETVWADGASEHEDHPSRGSSSSDKHPE